MEAYEIKKIKFEIRLNTLSQKILSELNFLETVIRNYNKDLDFIQKNVLRYTKYAMKFILLTDNCNCSNIPITESLSQYYVDRQYTTATIQDMHTKIYNKLNEFFRWNKLDVPTILKMQEIIDEYTLKISQVDTL
jgi:hypothetical protein